MKMQCTRYLAVLLMLGAVHLIAKYPLGSFSYLEPNSLKPNQQLCNTMRDLGYNTTVIQLNNESDSQVIQDLY